MRKSKKIQSKQGRNRARNQNSAVDTSLALVKPTALPMVPNIDGTTAMELPCETDCLPRDAISSDITDSLAHACNASDSKTHCADGTPDTKVQSVNITASDTKFQSVNVTTPDTKIKSGNGIVFDTETPAIDLLISCDAPRLPDGAIELDYVDDGSLTGAHLALTPDIETVCVSTLFAQSDSFRNLNRLSANGDSDAPIVAKAVLEITDQYPILCDQPTLPPEGRALSAPTHVLAITDQYSVVRDNSQGQISAQVTNEISVPFVQCESVSASLFEDSSPDTDAHHEHTFDDGASSKNDATHKSWESLKGKIRERMSADFANQQHQPPATSSSASIPTTPATSSSPSLPTTPATSVPPSILPSSTPASLTPTSPTPGSSSLTTTPPTPGSSSAFPSSATTSSSSAPSLSSASVADMAFIRTRRQNLSPSVVDFATYVPEPKPEVSLVFEPGLPACSRESIPQSTIQPTSNQRAVSYSQSGSQDPYSRDSIGDITITLTTSQLRLRALSSSDVSEPRLPSYSSLNDIAGGAETTIKMSTTSSSPQPPAGQAEPQSPTSASPSSSTPTSILPAAQNEERISGPKLPALVKSYIPNTTLALAPREESEAESYYDEIESIEPISASRSKPPHAVPTLSSTAALNFLKANKVSALYMGASSVAAAVGSLMVHATFDPNTHITWDTLEIALMVFGFAFATAIQVLYRAGRKCDQAQAKREDYLSRTFFGFPMYTSVLVVYVIAKCTVSGVIGSPPDQMLAFASASLMTTAWIAGASTSRFNATFYGVVSAVATLLIGSALGAASAFQCFIGNMVAAFVVGHTFDDKKNEGLSWTSITQFFIARSTACILAVELMIWINAKLGVANAVSEKMLLADAIFMTLGWSLGLLATSTVLKLEHGNRLPEAGEANRVIALKTPPKEVTSASRALSNHLYEEARLLGSVTKPDMHETEELLKRAIDINPTEPKFYSYYGHVLNRTARYREAQAMFTVATNLDPEGQSEAWMSLIALLFNQRMYTHARKACERAKQARLTPEQASLLQACEIELEHNLRRKCQIA